MGKVNSLFQLEHENEIAILMELFDLTEEEAQEMWEDDNGQFGVGA